MIECARCGEVSREKGGDIRLRGPHGGNVTYIDGDVCKQCFAKLADQVSGETDVSKAVERRRLDRAAGRGALGEDDLGAIRGAHD